VEAISISQLLVMNLCVMSRISNNLLTGVFIASMLFVLWLFLQLMDSVRELHPREVIQYNNNSKLLSIEQRVENNTIITVKVSKTFSKDESDNYRFAHKVFNYTFNTEFAEFFDLKRQAEDIGEIKKVIAWANIHCRDGLFFVAREILYSPSMKIIGSNSFSNTNSYDYYTEGFDVYHIKEGSDLDDIAKEVCPSSRY
jgi:hypothetical protein